MADYVVKFPAGSSSEATEIFWGKTDRRILVNTIFIDEYWKADILGRYSLPFLDLDGIPDIEWDLFQ